MTVKEFVKVCEERQDLMIKADDMASRFMRCTPDSIPVTFAKRTIKNVYSKSNGNRTEIVVEIV